MAGSFFRTLSEVRQIKEILQIFRKFRMSFVFVLVHQRGSTFGAHRKTIGGITFDPIFHAAFRASHYENFLVHETASLMRDSV